MIVCSIGDRECFLEVGCAVKSRSVLGGDEGLKEALSVRVLNLKCLTLVFDL